MDNEILPRIESTATGGINLIDEMATSPNSAETYVADLTTDPEDSWGLPESLTETVLGLLPVGSDYAANYKTILRLWAEDRAANYSRGFRAGRLAEREERG